MKLNTISPAEGSKHAKRRVGRGIHSLVQHSMNESTHSVKR